MDSNTTETWTTGYLVSGRYKLEHILGQGGFAQVWKAIDIKLSRSVAVKVLHPTVRLSDQDRFVAEARILARLNAPSIVAVHDAGIDAGRTFLIMEYIKGITLDTLVQKAPLTLGLGIDLAIQIAGGIHYLHQNSIIHRDIKPGNILVYRTAPNPSTGSPWTVKVSDFGLAKIIEGDLRSQTVSGPGLFAGTLPYLAPELITDARIGPSTDIYAFGVTLFEMFTGNLPFPETDIMSIFRRRDQPPPDPLSLNPELPSELATFLKRMLSPKPADRPDSAAEVAAFFQSIAIAHPPPDWTPPEELQETREKTPVSFLGEARAPSGFFTGTRFQDSLFFENDSVRFAKLEETLRFYRDHLNRDYETLVRQARTTYRLWAGCVACGAIVMLAGVGAMLLGHVAEGAATAAATTIVYFIQKIFQQREDFYRASAAVKAQHLEYGNHWVLVIQSIDAMRDREQQTQRQAKLVDVLIDKLKEKRPNQPLHRIAKKAGSR